MTHLQAGAGVGNSAHWEHFAHQADVGIRGCGPSLATAFEQAALAMIAVVAEPERIQPETRVQVVCSAADAELLLFDWLNALVYEMSTRNMLFAEFQVNIHDGRLDGSASGETIDRARHRPRVEIKGATLTELRVIRDNSGQWLAQCVLDV
jgi:SHS2 domain-containing protein